MLSFHHWLLEIQLSVEAFSIDSKLKSIYSTLLIINNEIVIHYHQYTEPKNFLLNTTDLIDSKIKNIYPIQIWEDQWNLKPDIIKSRLLNKLGKNKTIVGNLTRFDKITQEEADNFLNKNHLLGSTKAKYKFGLFYGSVLVAVATFTWPRKFYQNDGSIKYSYGLIRHCTLNYINIQGGLSKIISNFYKLFKPDDILTITDLDWSEGDSYLKLGFKLIEKTQAEVYFIDKNLNTRIHEKHSINIDTSDFIKITNTGNSCYKLYFSGSE